MSEEYTVKKVALRDKNGVLWMVKLQPEEHSHNWADISDAPEKTSIVTKGADGKLPANVIPGVGAGETPLTFGATNGVAGKFDRQTAVPTGSTMLRYNGYLRATRVFGMYFSDNADLAELYEVEDSAESGDLIEVADSGVLRVCQSERSPKVMGVVSDKPGFVLGWETDANKREKAVPIALAGRVPIKVVGHVEPGDYLAASSTPGAACAVKPDDVPRGCIIGMALGKHSEGGKGKVVSLVMRM